MFISRQVPLPCIQVSHMPTRSTSNEQKGTSVADHAPPTAPMVPSLVVHCVQEVERRGLSEVGLYRVPGSEQEVRDIRDHFQRGKGVPNMVSSSHFLSFLNFPFDIGIYAHRWQQTIHTFSFPFLFLCVPRTSRAIQIFENPNSI